MTEDEQEGERRFTRGSRVELGDIREACLSDRCSLPLFTCIPLPSQRSQHAIALPQKMSFEHHSVKIDKVSQVCI